MKPLDVNNSAVPQAKITTEAQARGFVEELISDMVLWRSMCDVAKTEMPKTGARDQVRALYCFLEKQGQVVGALKALLMADMISERCYKELTQVAINTLIPTIITG